jgi:hypothetical protein
MEKEKKRREGEKFGWLWRREILKYLKAIMFGAGQ